jgi:hypothetical protein
MALALRQGITEAKVDKVLEAIGKEKSFSFISGIQSLQNRQRIVSSQPHSSFGHENAARRSAALHRLRFVLKRVSF